ncbi:MAG: PqqD family protein [Bacilli bacterium]|nr:PqqD family protein [Bacilli bacterium]
MKLNSKFFTHETNGEHYMVSTGDTEFKGIVKNNDTAAFIIECLKENTTINDIVDKILAEYNVDDEKTVEKDVEVIIDKLRNIGAIEE